MAKIIAVLGALFLFCFQSFGCSMYKISKDGKTIVGNNEDWISPNSQFWFEKGEKGEFDSMYMGLLNRFPQGAMNSAGLVFDGFANDYMEIKNTEGKLSIPMPEAIQHVMKTMSKVNEVKAYLSTIDLSILATGQIVFVDQSGDYLIIEGGEMITGSELEQCFSNFYYSQIESIEEVDLDNVKNGLDFIRNSQSQSTIDYTSKVMQSMQSVGDLTQYTTVYDLEELKIRVYLFHDFSSYKEFTLDDFIKKGDHSVMIADLFPTESPGGKNYGAFNNPANPTEFYDNLVGDSKLTEAELESQGFSWIFNTIGYEWLIYKNDPKTAVSVFKRATELMPNNANLHDSLGEAYLANNQLKESKKAYEYSLELNPANEGAQEAIREIEERLAGG
ncbi:MAG: hypothetical protein AAGC47_09205 [Bacteroidota bacterium]